MLEQESEHAREVVLFSHGWYLWLSGTLGGSVGSCVFFKVLWTTLSISKENGRKEHLDEHLKDKRKT